MPILYSDVELRAPRKEKGIVVNMTEYDRVAHQLALLITEGHEDEVLACIEHFDDARVIQYVLFAMAKYAAELVKVSA